jgi:hypothetical protein
MTDFNFLISHPELAENLKFEIKGGDLLSLANSLIAAERERMKIESPKMEHYLSMDEVAKLVKRDRGTLFRWNKDGILKYNHINLYKKSDIEKFLNK